MSKLNGFFINMDRATDRRVHMEEQLERLGLHWISRSGAVDGYEAHRAMGSPPLPSHINEGGIGCLLSHRAVIERGDSDTYTLVLEDDTVLSSALSQTIHQGMVDAFAQCDIVFLECMPDYTAFNLCFRFATKGLKDNGLHTNSVLINDNSLHYGIGASAYIVTPRGREKMKEIFRQMDENGDLKPIDTTMHNAIHSGKLVSWMLLPFLASQSLYGFTSSIGYPDLEEDGGNNSLRRWFQLLSAFQRALFAGDIDKARPNVEELTGLQSTSREEQTRSILHACLDMHLDFERLA